MAKATVVINTRGGMVTSNQYCGGNTWPKVALGMINSFRKDAKPKNNPERMAVDHLFSKKQKDKVTSKATTAMEKPMGKILIALSNIIATNIVANIIANFATLYALLFTIKNLNFAPSGCKYLFCEHFDENKCPLRQSATATSPKVGGFVMQCFVTNKIAKVLRGKDSCVKVSFGYPIRPNYILPQINIKYNYIVKIFGEI